MTMSNSIQQLENILNLNNRLFINALEGVTEEQAKERLTGHNNPLSWIASHTVDARYLLLMLLGKSAQSPYKGMFENFKPFDPSITYPSLDNIKKQWAKTFEFLNEALKETSEEQLKAETPVKSPIGDFTNAGTIAFLIHHECYDIGQMGFLKKYFTQSGMKYD